MDFISVSNHRIRFSPGEILPRYDSQNQPFVVTILDDDEEEMIEYFEVLIEVESNGYPFPSRVGQVTILDDDACKMNILLAYRKIISGVLEDFLMNS